MRLITCEHTHLAHVPCTCVRTQTHRHTHRYRQTDRHTNRQTQIHTHTQMNRQTDAHTRSCIHMTYNTLILISLLLLFLPAILNMDNSVVDMETLQALYENVSTPHQRPGITLTDTAHSLAAVSICSCQPRRRENERGTWLQSAAKPVEKCQEIFL